MDKATTIHKTLKAKYRDDVHRIGMSETLGINRYLIKHSPLQKWEITGNYIQKDGRQHIALCLNYQTNGSLKV